MRSSAYTDFLTNDFNIVEWYDFQVPYNEGFHIQSHDRHLRARVAAVDSRNLHF